jgi:hypothetical protein
MLIWNTDFRQVTTGGVPVTASPQEAVSRQQIAMRHAENGGGTAAPNLGSGSTAGRKLSKISEAPQAGAARRAALSLAAQRIRPTRATLPCARLGAYNPTRNPNRRTRPCRAPGISVPISRDPCTSSSAFPTRNTTPRAPHLQRRNCWPRRRRRPKSNLSS